MNVNSTALNIANTTTNAPSTPKIKSGFARELNALVTIAARDITLTLKTPGKLLLSLVMPLIFMGMLGGSLAQNMTGGLGFEYGTFMMVGMMVNVLYMMTTDGVASLVQDRSENFTQELMVSPISRYSIVLGKIIGASVTAMVQLIGTIIIALLMGIHFEAWQLLAFLSVTPLICLAAGSVAMMVVAFIKNDRIANILITIIIMPQMFLSGAIIPINNSSGILYILSRLMPMTYCLDLARSVFYAGTPEYASVVLFNPAVTLLAILGLTAAFLIIGTYFFARTEVSK